jgi:drug/metabolite transporter (DMT)-like permease
MSWQLFLIISISAEVAGRLLQRIVLKDDKSDPVAYSVVVQLITGVLVGAFALVQGFSIPNLSEIWPHLLAMPVLWGLSNLFIYKSLKSTEASVFVILFSTRAVWQILAAIIFLNEVFTLYQVFGTVLILGSVLLVSSRNAKFSFKKGEVFAVLAAIFFGAAMINDAFVIRSFDVASYLTFGFFLPALLIWLIHPKKTSEIISVARNTSLWKTVLLAAFFGISALTTLLAYKIGSNAAQIGALSQVTTILTVFAAIFLLSERKSLILKIIAGVISVLGVLLII